MEAVTMIKAAALAAQNKNNIGKILTILLGILLAPLILILMVYVQVMSAFSPEGLLQSPDTFDGANSAVYQSIHAVTDPFYEEIDTQLDAAESDIQRYNTYVYDIIDDQGRTQTVRDEPGITKKKHYISESVIIAYLLQTDGAIDTATGYINEEVTENFLHSICTVTSSNVGDNNWIVENKILTINQIAELYFTTETEQTRYKFACNAYSEYFDVSESEVDGTDGIDRVFDANLADVPLYLQYDPTWGGISYGNGTIRKNGCCPTCLAMGWKPLLCKWIRNILEHFCTGSCTMGCFLQGNRKGCRADAGSVVSGEACCGKYGTGNIYAWRTFYSAYRYY